MNIKFFKIKIEKYLYDLLILNSKYKTKMEYFEMGLDTHFITTNGKTKHKKSDRSKKAHKRSYDKMKKEYRRLSIINDIKYNSTKEMITLTNEYFEEEYYNDYYNDYYDNYYNCNCCSDYYYRFIKKTNIPNYPIDYTKYENI